MTNELDTTDLDVTEKYSGGVYARSISIPKDTFIVGARHKLDNLNVMTSGRLLLQVIEDGVVSETKEVIAPYFLESKAGSMKIAVAMEDTVWTSFSNTDVREENVYTDEESEEFYLSYKEKICLLQ